MKIPNIKERRSPGPRDSVPTPRAAGEQGEYDRAKAALTLMHDAYTAIGFKRPDCRLYREGGQSSWFAYCCDTTGFGDSERRAVRDVARVWSQAMQDAKWVDALVKAGATPDQIRNLAEAISAAMDMLSEEA